MDWEHIDKFDWSKDYPFIHCDTRDFHLIGSDVGESKIPVRHNKFTKAEIKEYLSAMEQATGGRGKWRMISFVHHGGWWKYLRFKNVGPDTYLGYCEQGKPLPLNRNRCTPENVKKDHYLNFCRDDI